MATYQIVFLGSVPISLIPIISRSRSLIISRGVQTTKNYTLSGLSRFTSKRANYVLIRTQSFCDSADKSKQLNSIFCLEYHILIDGVE